MSMKEISSQMSISRSRSQQRPCAYGLKVGSGTSNRYYSDIAAFAGQWTEGLHPWLEESVTDYQNYRSSHKMKARSFDEVALEMLALGVCLREHGFQAEATPLWAIQWLQKLVDWQERFPRFEKELKTLRGLLNGLFYRRQAQVEDPDPGTESLQHLILWLRVQGGEAQAARFNEWLAYLQQLQPQAALACLHICLLLARLFEGLSQQKLGAYTRTFENFHQNMPAGARWRYDIHLINSSRLEYHLGMLATEILNRSYRAGFEAARHKLVILPPCLRAQPEHECMAIQTPLGAECGGCTYSCRVNQISRAAAQKGIRVVMIPDDQLSNLCLASGQAGKGLGVIGAACALRNWSAGWEANRLGLNAQGIVLDYAGCGKHWQKQDVPTDINLQQLYQQF